MYLCYLDDSGDSRHGVTITAMLVEEREWTSVLDAWLQGRREIHRTFGVLKKAEVHASELYNGRGRYCDSDAENRSFGSDKRAAAGRMLLAELARAKFEVVTIGTSAVSKPKAYARAIT